MASQHYQKIADHIRDAINTGNLAPGDELPSEAELCEQFGSSRGPVRQAMMLLRTEGMISTGRGRRSTVLARSSHKSFDSAVSITSWLEAHNHIPGQQTLLMARQPACEEIAGYLRLEPGTHLITLRRLRSADGRPVAIETLYFPVEIGRHILELDTDAQSIYAHLGEHDIVVDNISRCITATIADAEQAQLLQIAQGDPLLRVRMSTADQYGRIISYGDHFFPAENLTLSLNTVRGTPSPACLTPVE
ncbi:MAG: GntR family transcriptional regulator [Corynebacterium sp.]|uniref:GntR family transcriptional regulator n=1 Tax=Corynebacterium sp. TaxID=1720 RepID=UPI0026DEBE05|nr:GntR family transcriptional regulator [Corynebacterium sp.]MDO5668727.1 GntR family transcriptional regulator [Corynebacterium sp.]